MEGMGVVILNENNSGNIRIVKHDTITDCKAFLFDKMSNKTFYRNWKIVDCDDGWRFTAEKCVQGNWHNVEYFLLSCGNVSEE